MSDLSGIYERLGAMDAKISAAHTRVDEFKAVVGTDLVEIKSDLKALIAKENKRAGWVAAMMLVGTILSGIIGYFLKG